MNPILLSLAFLPATLALAQNSPEVLSENLITFKADAPGVPADLIIGEAAQVQSVEPDSSQVIWSQGEASVEWTYRMVSGPYIGKHTNGFRVHILVRNSDSSKTIPVTLCAGGTLTGMRDRFEKCHTLDVGSSAVKMEATLAADPDRLFRTLHLTLRRGGAGAASLHVSEWNARLILKNGETGGNETKPRPDPKNPIPTPTATAGPDLILTREERAELAGVYTPRGVGGGGAMTSYSISPYSALRIVGTDMGSLYRSLDGGKNWIPIDQRELRVSQDLQNGTYAGFSPDRTTIFYAQPGANSAQTAGTVPMRSLDSGATWRRLVGMPIASGERIRYWTSDVADPAFIMASTNGGVLVSFDKGETWKRAEGIESESKGTFLYRNSKNEPVIFHAEETGIFVSRDRGLSFTPWFQFEDQDDSLRWFAGGYDQNGLTLAFIDNRGEEACAWAETVAPNEHSYDERIQTMAHCGWVWVKKQSEGEQPNFTRTQQEGGAHLRMASNDSSTLYVTGGIWMRQYGSKIWVSRDTGKAWELSMYVYDWDVPNNQPYRPWPSSKLEYSAVGVSVGWHDNSYTSFSINPFNSREAGGTGYYFLHVTQDSGATWTAPFTRFADDGERTTGKRWQSVGLEVTSATELKFHPKNPQIGYAAYSDIAGLATEDGGKTWRIITVPFVNDRGRTVFFNSNYDYAFDPENDQVVFAATGDYHDYPLGIDWIYDGSGGIFRSEDRGRNWTRITPAHPAWDRQFLAVAYDPIHGVIYGGTQGGGIGRSVGGGNWEFINKGLPKFGNIIPQIEVDPKNGNVYILLAGDSPNYSNQTKTGIYFLDVANGAERWELLRGKVPLPAEVNSTYVPWWYPTTFAVDWSVEDRSVLWLGDSERKGSWLASGIWKSTDRGQNWTRTTQFTHPTSITIDPIDPSRVYASGRYHLDTAWGDGGAKYTLDGGTTWKKNDVLPFVANVFGVRPDPNSPGNVFYLFFGGGMLHGPQPPVKK